MFPSEMNPKGSNMKSEGDIPQDAIPLKRVGTEEEIAGVCLFLASPAGGYMNGGIMLCDGGRVGIFPSSY